MPNDLPLADHDLDLDHAVCFLRLLWFKNINSSEVISAKVKDKKNQNIIYEVLFGIVGIVHVVFRKISLKSLFLLEIEPTFYSNFSLIHFFFHILIYHGVDDDVHYTRTNFYQVQALLWLLQSFSWLVKLFIRKKFDEMNSIYSQQFLNDVSNFWKLAYVSICIKPNDIQNWANEILMMFCFIRWFNQLKLRKKKLSTYK